MTICLNKRMERMLLDKGLVQILEDNRLEIFLEKLIEDGFVEFQGCFVLKSLLPEGYSLSRALLEFADETELECSTNNIYLNNLIRFSEPAPNQVNYILAQGIQFARGLEQRLVEEKQHFKIVVSFSNENDLIDCSVRFYIIRPNQEWLDDNLDNYVDNAIYVITG